MFHFSNTINSKNRVSTKIFLMIFINLQFRTETFQSQKIFFFKYIPIQKWKENFPFSFNHRDFSPNQNRGERIKLFSIRKAIRICRGIPRSRFPRFLLADRKAPERVTGAFKEQFAETSSRLQFPTPSVDLFLSRSTRVGPQSPWP